MEKKLNTLLKQSYSPYSNVKVAAILVAKDGKEFKGVNVESATHTPTVCAERTALVTAATKGYRLGDFKEIHLTSSTSDFLFPCGVCRQLMSEFFEPTTKIHVHSHGKVKIVTYKELMPFSVTREDLK